MGPSTYLATPAAAHFAISRAGGCYIIRSMVEPSALRRFIQPRALGILFIVGAGAALFFWAAWPRLAGIPAWLRSVGLLSWLSALEPLDRWITSIGAVLIGLYAIFHETLWVWIRRPKLEVSFDSTRPYCIAIPIRVSSSTIIQGVIATVEKVLPSFQIRLVVKNRGSARADNVEVYAVRLRERHGTEDVSAPWFLPMNLVWANADRPYVGISRDVERTCDIAGILKPGKEVQPRERIPHAPDTFSYETTSVVRLHTEVTATSYSNYLFPGSYILDLVVSAGNAKSRKLSLSIRFDGRWFDKQDQMFAEAVVVSLLKG